MGTFRKLFACVGKYKKETILSSLYMGFEVLCNVLMPFFVAKLIDNGIQSKDTSYMIKMGVISIIITILGLIFGALSGKYAATASTGFAKNVRQRMYNNIQTFAFSNIDKFSTASIVTRLTTDVINLQNSYQMLVRVAIRAPMMLILAFLMATITSPKLSIIFLGVLIFLSIALYFIIKSAYKYVKTIYAQYDNLNRVTQEDLSGIRVVKSYVREKFEENKFYKVSKAIYEKFVKAQIAIALVSPVMVLCVNICVILISWFGSKLILDGSMETGDLITLVTYANQMLFALMMLSIILISLVMSKASAERVIAILDEKADIVTNNSKEKLENGDIEFKNVDFSYTNDENKKALKNINFNIKSGEMVGIIGATGSSKSTLVSLIPRLYDTMNGNITVGGKDINKYDLKEIRDGVAMVLQKNTLFSGTIKENLKWGNENATEEEIIKACKIANADDFIQTFEEKYETVIDQGGTNVSGGQKQRICIARALLKNPKILILDDSTSAVDTKTDASIRKGLKHTLPDVTKIIISQRISTIQLADKIIVLNEGEIDGIGNHEYLMNNNSIYKEIFELQNKGGTIDD